MAEARARKQRRAAGPRVPISAASPVPDIAADLAEAAANVAREPGMTMAGHLHRQLEAAIVAGSFKPGDRLDEQEIAQRYGMSRTPVREAFRLLGADDLVELRGRQGVVVRKIAVHVLIEMFQVMAELEGLCARLAARRITPQQERRLETVHTRLAEAAKSNERDPSVFYDINQEFHEEIYDASRNGYLAEETRKLRNRVAPFRRRVTAMPRRFETTLSEHETIMQALRERDAERAHTAMRDHVNLLGDDLTDFIASYE